jgi:hypothetical protein
MPQNGQSKRNEHDAGWKSRSREELTHGKEVRDARNSQQNKEGRFTSAA